MAQGLVAQRAWPLTASSLTSLLLPSVRVISGAMREQCGCIAVGPHAGYRLAPRSPKMAPTSLKQRPTSIGTRRGVLVNR